jgi:drug/metabolite transporter (DMT)-like permease
LTYQVILLHTGFIIAQLPALMCWREKNNNWPETIFIKPFVWLIAFSALYEAIITFQFRVNPTVWFKVYTFLEFVCINYFFLKLLGKRYERIFYAWLVVFVLVFIGLQVLWLNGGSANTDSGLVILEILLVYVASIIWFKNTFTNMELTTLWESPAFYYVCGFVLYFSGTFFLFLMNDLVSKIEMSKHWNINVYLSLLLSIIIIIGIWKNHQKSRQYSG